MITTQTATVYFSPTAKRRFLTLKGASEAEAKARIFGKYPSESYEDDTGAGYNIEYDEPQRYTKMQRRLAKFIRRAYYQARDIRRTSGQSD